MSPATLTAATGSVIVVIVRFVAGGAFRDGITVPTWAAAKRFAQFYADASVYDVEFARYSRSKAWTPPPWRRKARSPWRARAKR